MILNLKTSHHDIYNQTIKNQRQRKHSDCSKRQKKSHMREFHWGYQWISQEKFCRPGENRKIHLKCWIKNMPPKNPLPSKAIIQKWGRSNNSPKENLRKCTTTKTPWIKGRFVIWNEKLLINNVKHRKIWNSKV